MAELARVSARERTRRTQMLRGAGIGELAIAADRPWVDSLVRYFHNKERR
jgi:hypothetical protein